MNSAVGPNQKYKHKIIYMQTHTYNIYFLNYNIIYDIWYLHNNQKNSDYI